MSWLALLLATAFVHAPFGEPGLTAPASGWTKPVVTPRSKLPITRPGPTVYVDPTKTCPALSGKPVRVGSILGPPPLLEYVAPPAPPDDASGTVILQAVVEGDGSVTHVKPLRDPAGLAPVVTGAVEKWRYARMCLNGVPVPVIMTIALTYTAPAR